MIDETKHKLPWFISIWGEDDYDYRPLMKRVIEPGGHIKTGLELLQEAQAIANEVGGLLPSG